MINFSMVISGAAAITYLLDTHGGNTLHVFALTNFLKNMVIYGFNFFANGMVLYRGVKVTLLILAACQAFCMLLTIPMYRYGKRVRAFVSRPLTFWLFVYWRWWYWDLPPSELRSRAGSILVYDYIYSCCNCQCEITGYCQWGILVETVTVSIEHRSWIPE